MNYCIKLELADKSICEIFTPVNPENNRKVEARATAIDWFENVGKYIPPYLSGKVARKTLCFVHDGKIFAISGDVEAWKRIENLDYEATIYKQKDWLKDIKIETYASRESRNPEKSWLRIAHNPKHSYLSKL